jgi:hypothetical protein
MNRCLHVTIKESPGAEPGSASPNLPGQASSDPSTNYVMPPPDGGSDSTDPSTNIIIPPPDGGSDSTAPSTNIIMPPPDGRIPSPGGGSSVCPGSPAGCGAAWETVQVCSSGDLLLPQQVRTTIKQVHLAAGARADAAFLVAADPGFPLTAGHSFACRQRWHGEVVGRITWSFGLSG